MLYYELSQDQSFPKHENGIQVGMKLEGIDAWHPSVFCVLSVAEVRDGVTDFG